MKILGITAEYNPFHNGHIYHLKKAMEVSGADRNIVVMSGNFVQRGEPAIADKWIRARQAVISAEENDACADLVVELPFAFACNRAEFFARGAVDMMAKAGVNCISFGCEEDNPEKLESLVNVMIDEKDSLESRTSEIMSNGISRAKAYSIAIEETSGAEAAGILRQPNNILALEYIKRIRYWNNRGYHIEILPIKRIGASYDGVEDLSGNSGIAGATAIRKMIAEGKDTLAYVPSKIRYEKIDAVNSRFFIMLKAIIVRSEPEELADIYCVGEGLHYKMKMEISDTYSLDEFVNRLVSRRYTEATIRRILTYVLLGIKKDDMNSIVESENSFARVLAAGGKGRELIRKLKAEKFNIITNINKQMPEDEMSQRLMRMTIHSSDMYNMLCGKDMYNFSDRVIRPYIVLS